MEGSTANQATRDEGSAMSTSKEASVIGHESLMEFKEVFNFDSFVQEQLVPAESEGAGPDVVRSSAHLIGQERDGGLLFAWDSRSSRSENIVTHVGWYSQASPAYRTLYRHNARANICSASVNFERSLIAFTVRVCGDGSDLLYDSVVAEIQPAGRQFDLDLRSSEYRKAQFVWPESATPRNRLGRNQQISRLVVIVPDAFAAQYSFKMQNLQTGAVVAEEPRKEIVAHHFSWYQWDPHTQWLYHGKFERSATPVQASMSGRNSLTLTCTSFVPPSPLVLFVVALPLPYKQQVYSSVRTYYPSPFHFTVPVREMNLQVLHRREGFWCACLQHCTGTAVTSDTNVEGEELDTPTGSKVDYSVYIIHNGYVMYGQVPLAVPAKEEHYIHFMLLSHFLVAYVSGFMLQLLNIGPQTDPCHHLAFGPSDTPLLPTRGSEGVAPILSMAVSKPFLSDYHAALVEAASGVIYECSLNTKGFLQLFKGSQRAELKEDLMHLMIVCFHDHGRTLSMIEHICQTPTELVDHRLFAEFIVASSFASVQFDCNRFVAKQLPLTISPSFRGRVVKKVDGSRLAWLKLTPMPNFIKQLQVQSDQSLVAPTPDLLFSYTPREEQPCENLCYLVLTCQPDIPRVDMSTHPAQTTPISSTYHRRPRRDLQGSRREQGREGASKAGRLFDTLTDFTRRTLITRSLSAHTSHNFSEKLSFLQCDSDLADLLTEQESGIRDYLLHTIAKDLSPKAKSVVHVAVASYMDEIQRHSCMLLHLIWTSLGLEGDIHPLSLPLNRLASPTELVAFELLEAYHTAHLELGIPPPYGFHTLFTSLGYICLPPILFLQYLRNGVLVPTQHFVRKLLEEAESVDESILFHVVSFLQPGQAEAVLKDWDNCTVKHLQASRGEGKGK